MILTNEEKERIAESLFWMIKDMQYRHNEIKNNSEEGIQGGYSDELKAAMNLLEDVQKVKAIETIVQHRKSMFVNCREFACESNKQGICVLSKITLESKGSLIVGELNCMQAEKAEKPKEEGEKK